MGAFVSSMLGSAVVLAVMYLVYRWAISGTSDHGFNRGVLIAIYLLAFAVCPLWDSLSHSPLPGGDVALGLPAADDAVVSDVFEVIIEAPGVMTEPAVPNVAACAGGHISCRSCSRGDIRGARLCDAAPAGALGQSVRSMTDIRLCWSTETASRR